MRLSQGTLHIRYERVRFSEHATRNPHRVLECTHSLVEIVERSVGVQNESPCVAFPHFECESMSFSESASRHGYHFAHQYLDFFEAL